MNTIELALVFWCGRGLKLDVLPVLEGVLEASFESGRVNHNILKGLLGCLKA